MSPGRWAFEDRRYQEDHIWREAAARYMTFLWRVGTPEMSASLALGKVTTCPFGPEGIEELKSGVITFFQSHGLVLSRHQDDRKDIFIDYRYISLFLQASKDFEVSLRQPSRGILSVSAAFVLSCKCCGCCRRFMACVLPCPQSLRKRDVLQLDDAGTHTQFLGTALWRTTMVRVRRTYSYRLSLRLPQPLLPRFQCVASCQGSLCTCKRP